MRTMLIRHEPTSASSVRRELALDLDLHGIDEDVIDEVTLVASELIGNAVRHAGLDSSDELDVTWTVRDHEVEVSVEDPSDELPVSRHATPDEENGRGLTIIEALTSNWGYAQTARGKRVWAKIPLRHAS